MRHPREMGASEVEAFLTHLATDRKVSASTHNQALSAILFLYREVLAIELPWLNGINRPTQKRRIPSVLTKDEVAGLLAQMDGVTALIARLLYGTGMRLMEGLRRRIKDVEFVGLVLDVSITHFLYRSAKRRGTAPPFVRRPGAARVEKGGTDGRNYQTGVRSHAAPLFCHASAAVGHRHPNSARTAGPFRRVHHHDLHPRAEGGGGRHGEPAGCSRPWALSDRFEVRGQRTAQGRLLSLTPAPPNGQPNPPSPASNGHNKLLTP